MYQRLFNYINQIEEEIFHISDERRSILQNLIDEIIQREVDNLATRLTFICTHNSRCSQLCQVWATVANHYYQISGVSSFSGGTEETAFHKNAIMALEEAGFTVDKPIGNNPHYSVRFAANEQPVVCYSKRYDHMANPKTNFYAVMNCAEAESNCPIVAGANKIIPIRYQDPKKYDDTSRETLAYNNCCRTIATEMFYVFHMVALKM